MRIQREGVEKCVSLADGAGGYNIDVNNKSQATATTATEKKTISCITRSGQLMYQCYSYIERWNIILKCLYTSIWRGERVFSFFITISRHIFSMRKYKREIYIVKVLKKWKVSFYNSLKGLCGGWCVSSMASWWFHHTPSTNHVAFFSRHYPQRQSIYFYMVHNRSRRKYTTIWEIGLEIGSIFLPFSWNKNENGCVTTEQSNDFYCLCDERIIYILTKLIRIYSRELKTCRQYLPKW